MLLEFYQTFPTNIRRCSLNILSKHFNQNQTIIHLYLNISKIDQIFLMKLYFRDAEYYLLNFLIDFRVTNFWQDSNKNVLLEFFQNFPTEIPRYSLETGIKFWHRKSIKSDNSPSVLIITLSLEIINRKYPTQIRQNFVNIHSNFCYIKFVKIL